MNYEKHYYTLIERRKASPALGYTETHHIIPKCIGGTDTPDNKVSLLPEEHFIAHKLLAKMYPNSYGLIKAVICMGMSSRTHKRNYNKSYAWERRRMAELQSGEGNPFYGKHHTEEHKLHISNIMKGRKITWGDKISDTKRRNPTKWSDEAKAAHSINQSGKNNGMFGRKHSEETKAKIRLNRKDTQGKNNPSAKKIVVAGVEYGCMKDASIATGLSMYKLRQLRNL